MNTTASPATSPKARLFKLVALTAVAGLGLGIVAPFASAGPLDKIKILGTDKVLGTDVVTQYLLNIKGPDVITIKPNEAHLLSEYFSISFTKLAAGGNISTAGGARLFPGDKDYLTFFSDTASADMLSTSMKVTAPGSITITASDGSRLVTRTAAVLLAAPVTTAPPVVSSVPPVVSSVPPVVSSVPPVVSSVPPVVSTAPPVVITVPPVSATTIPPVLTTVAPVVSTVVPATTVAPATTAAPAVPAPAGNRAPVASPMSFVAASGLGTPFALQGSDPDGSPVTFALGQMPQHGKLTGQAPNLAYTADAGFVGVDAFTFTVSDGKDSSGAATVMVTATGSTKALKAGKAVKVKVRKVCRGKGLRRVCR